MTKSAMELHEENKQKLSEADAKLDILDNMTASMVTKANEINVELKDQNKMIDATTEKMERADQGIVKATEKVNKVGETTKGGWASWICAGILLIGLIIILSIGL